MRHRSVALPILRVSVLLLLAAVGSAQELPKSGVSGIDLVWATSPAGTTSQLYLVNLQTELFPLPVGAPIANVPSRWAHRRRNLGALEARMVLSESGLSLFTPLGDAVGNGAIHMVDGRTFPIAVEVFATGNPAGYDLALSEELGCVFAAEDDGAGGTTLRGFSFATPGTLVPLDPPSLTLPGPPSAYVNRIGVEAGGEVLHVPTSEGIAVVSLSESTPNMSLGTFVSTLPAHPTTNPITFDRNGTATWMVGTSTFAGGAPDGAGAGWQTWTAGGADESATFGAVPTAPRKNWVPAAGCHELAVVGDGTDTYVYYLLREPPPGTFFIKPAAVGAVAFVGSSSGLTGTLLCPDDCGEPFANPAAHGTRVAFESSFGPPFIFQPADGGEKVSIVYSPLDTLGEDTTFGALGVPAPLGGRISTKGMDRPIWSRDGTQLFACTSWFPGAPSVGLPGLEALDVPAGVALNAFVAPHTVVPAATFPDQSIGMPGSFEPRDTGAAAFLDGLTFVGGLFHDGIASAVAFGFGELGQKQLADPPFFQSSEIPNFRAIHPPSFEDAAGSLVPVPGSFGARRLAFNLHPALGLQGVVMTGTQGDALIVQLTGTNILATLGLVAPEDYLMLDLPLGWITTTEIFSL